MIDKQYHRRSYGQVVHQMGSGAPMNECTMCGSFLEPEGNFCYLFEVVLVIYVPSYARVHIGFK